MFFKEFIVKQNDSGRRLDRVLLKLFPDESASFIQKNIRNGFVRLNGKKTKPDARVSPDDVIGCAGFLNQAQPNVDTFKNTDASIPQIPIIFNNQNIVIYNKPYNISVQPSQKNELSLTEYTLSNFPAESSLSFKPGPLHRIDRRTTGLVVFSQSLEGAKTISAVLSSATEETDSCIKTYLAIIQGGLSSDAIWEDTISPADSNNSFKTMEISKKSTDNPSGKKAITFIKPIASGIYKISNTGRHTNKKIESSIPVTFVKVIIKTGRKHQIRLQCSYHGFPLLGDTAYGGNEIFEDQQLFLHAFRLDFPSKVSDMLNGIIHFEAPLPECFKSMLRKCLIEKADSIIL